MNPWEALVDIESMFCFHNWCLCITSQNLLLLDNTLYSCTWRSSITRTILLAFISLTPNLQQGFWYETFFPSPWHFSCLKALIFFFCSCHSTQPFSPISSFQGRTKPFFCQVAGTKRNAQIRYLRMSIISVVFFHGIFRDMHLSWMMGQIYKYMVIYSL